MSKGGSSFRRSAGLFGYEGAGALCEAGVSIGTISLPLFCAFASAGALYAVVWA